MSEQNIRSDNVTPASTYFQRRDILKAAGVGLASLGLGGVISTLRSGDQVGPSPEGTDELGNPVNPMVHATGFSNYYDVSIDKNSVPRLAKFIQTDPWTVEVGGLVERPQTFSIEDLVSEFGSQQEIYRLRCVEAWSAVIPWDGFKLRSLLEHVGVNPKAKFVRFESKYDPLQFLGQQNLNYPWPYVEALRLDEALNELTMMALGMYGQPLAKQSGAPIRLIVPWKYGFKSAKAIVKIELTEEKPATFWNVADAPRYGFYANVNPDVDHPNWSQAREFRLGNNHNKVPTLMFNGYGRQVAHLYQGMDLVKDY